MRNNDSLTEEYFTFFFKSNYSKVKKVAYSLLKSEFDAEDVAQEVFAKLWEQQEIWVNNERKLDSYLLVMVRNAVINIFKHQQIRFEYQERFTKELSCVDDVLFDRICQREMLQSVYATLKKMPERRREVFEHSRFHGESHKEIAGRMNISVRTVEQQIYLTLVELRKVLPGFWYTK